MTPLEMTVAAVRRASRLAMAVRAEFSADIVSDKGAGDPVTVADWGAQAIICRALQMHDPTTPIIGEENLELLGRDPATLETVTRFVDRVHPATSTQVAEWISAGSARTHDGRCWTVDPIDGTKGFVRGDQFAIAVALIEDGRPIIAVLGCPAYRGGMLFAAEAGNGSTANDKPIRVSDLRDPSQARLTESVERWTDHSSHDRIAKTLGITKPPLRLDSQVKHGAIAAGHSDILLRLRTDPTYRETVWDHAAGTLIVTEAGGRVTDFDGDEIDFSEAPYLSIARGIVVTNGHLHDATLAAIARD